MISIIILTLIVKRSIQYLSGTCENIIQTISSITSITGFVSLHDVFEPSKNIVCRLFVKSTISFFVISDYSMVRMHKVHNEHLMCIVLPGSDSYNGWRQNNINRIVMNWIGIIKRCLKIIDRSKYFTKTNYKILPDLVSLEKIKQNL